MDETTTVYKTREEALRAKLREVTMNYNRLTQHVREAGSLVGKLMRHKDATPDDLQQAHAMYSEHYHTWLQVRTSLRTLYPQRQEAFDKYPWWKEGEL